MKKAVTAFFMSWGMFLAIPCPYRAWDEKYRRFMLVFFPVIGLIIGAVWAAAAYVLQLAGWMNLFGAVVLTAIPYMLTGFIHLDGFMDCCDAILSRRALSERQRILKDPHTGAFAVICLCILLLFCVALFSVSDLSGREHLLIFIPIASRASAAMGVLILKPIGHSSYAAGSDNGTGKGVKIALLLIGLISIALPVIFHGIYGLCSLAAVCGSSLAILYGYKQLGGMSGDIAGYAVTIGEVCAIAALALI